MNQSLRKAVSVCLGTAAIALAASNAQAITVTNLGTIPNDAVGKTSSNTVPQYAWDGWNGVTANLGWAHNSKWYRFKTSALMTVEIRMTTTSPAAQMKPAFSLWKTTANFVGGNHLAHEYNQVSLGGASSFLKPYVPPIGPPVTDGTTKFIGYVNAGPAFVNGDGNSVASGTAGISAIAPKTAIMTVTLAKGSYLIVVGGSCNNQSCGAPAPKPFTLKIVKAAAARLADTP